MAESNSNESENQNPYKPTDDSHSPVLIPGSLSVPLAIGLAVIIVVACIINLGAGISLIVVSVPAYIRAAGISFQKIASGEELSTSSRIVAFISSIMVVTVCAIAGGIGFFVTCIGILSVGSGAGVPFFGSGGGEAMLLAALALCGIGFLASAGVVYWLFWPKRKRK